MNQFSLRRLCSVIAVSIAAPLVTSELVASWGALEVGDRDKTGTTRLAGQGSVVQMPKITPYSEAPSIAAEGTGLEPATGCPAPEFQTRAPSLECSVSHEIPLRLQKELSQKLSERCPHLSTEVLTTLAQVLGQLGLSPGDQTMVANLIARLALAH